MSFFDLKAPAQGTVALVVVTALVTVVATQFGTTILSVLAWPFRKLGRALYQKVAPRNPANLSFRRYRRHLSNSLAKIENPVGPAIDVPLEHAYAPLRLKARETDEPEDIFDLLRQNKRLIVVGGPGTGKTTLMKSLLLTTIKKPSEPLEGLRPVFVTLRKLAASGHTVEQAITESFAEHARTRSPERCGRSQETGIAVPVGRRRECQSGLPRAYP
jgi:hypothetical protein